MYTNDVRKVERMVIKTNRELAQAIDKAISESGYKRGYIADQLGIVNQSLKKSIYKKNMSLDEANKILHLVDCEAEIAIKNIEKQIEKELMIFPKRDILQSS